MTSVLRPLGSTRSSSKLDHGDSLPIAQLSIFYQLMQICYGYTQPIAAGNWLSNRKYCK